MAVYAVMRWYICVVVVSVAVSFLCSVPCHAQEEQDIDSGQHEEGEESEGTTVAPLSIETKYRAIEESFKNIINSLIKQALPKIIEFQDKADLSPECMGSFLKIMGKMRNLDRETFRSKSECMRDFFFEEGKTQFFFEIATQLELVGGFRLLVRTVLIGLPFPAIDITNFQDKDSDRWKKKRERESMIEALSST